MSIYNTPLEERFGEKLEELREGKNMTREQLAEQVGLTARHIAALERGERRPTLNTMEKLLRTLGDRPSGSSIRNLKSKTPAYTRYPIWLLHFQMNSRNSCSALCV